MLKLLIPLAIALALPATAAAQDTRVTMAAGACQSALPVFDGVVRKRPLAVQNDGTTRTFITCGLEGRFGAAESSSLIFVGLTNNADADASVSCTLVDGRNGISDPVYRAKSINVPANADVVELAWTSIDNEGVDFIYPAISCSIPPGIGIKAVSQSFVPTP